MPAGNEARMERVMGIEPTLEAWEAPVLPLNYTRTASDSTEPTPDGQAGAPQLNYIPDVRTG